MTVYSAVVLLFLVMDPLGNIPFFLTTLKHVDPARHKRIIIRELCIALAVLVAFLFLGEYILRVLGISEPSLTIAGGIILFLISIRMVFPASTGSLFEEVGEDEPFIVPLAIPFIAGPSALAVILLIMSRNPERWGEWLLALLIAWSLTGVILYFGSDLGRLLRQRGLVAVERLMGLILAAVAVQMFLRGLAIYLERL